MTSIKFRALTHNDHKLFFEALGEHGKDFQNIQQYMAQKCGKSNNKSSEQNKSIDPQEKREQDKKEEDKKREQIRNFYNKLYGKLSQLIGRLDDRVEKVNQELYLLINYGEIWKKHGFKFNNKTKKLLEDLVHQGYATLRFKNKNVRLRTPPCKALKKINEIGIDEKVKVVTTRELPKDVIVEFHPATNRDWLKVQSISQNPRARARLSIQKRVSALLEFLENKWNVSQNKLNRTVEAWLKVPPNNLPIEDIQQQNPPNSGNSSGVYGNSRTELQIVPNNDSTIGQLTQNPTSLRSVDLHSRLRLKPSAQHELKEVNITRVVPDNHLDLSLTAYISRLSESIPKNNEPSCKSSNNSTKDSPTLLTNPLFNNLDGGMIHSENLELSQGAMSASSSRLPVSLTTPDCSILLERSWTSDQPPSIAQARRHLNILQSLAGSFEGCENSRTACEDAQDRSLLTTPQLDSQRSSSNFGVRVVSFADVESNKASSMTVMVNNTIPALFDEDAAIDTALSPNTSQEKFQTGQVGSTMLTQHSSDSQNSKSVDFHIPKNLTLGDWFKMNGQRESMGVGGEAVGGGGDEANDAFPIVEQAPEAIDESIGNACENKGKTDEMESCFIKAKNDSTNSSKPTNHMIEIEKLAEGWTRQDETSMTIGELYLAFKCPDKIILEYEFEQFTFNANPTNQPVPTSIENSDCLQVELAAADGTTIVPEAPSDNTLLFKLLTAASLSLAHIERQKQEQQHKINDQPGSKLKRRKGPSNPNTIKYLKRDDLLAASSHLRVPSLSGGIQAIQSGGITNNQLSLNNQLNNQNYMTSNSDKNQGLIQNRTLHDIETTNQRVEEALKLLQPTRLTIRRAR